MTPEEAKAALGPLAVMAGCEAEDARRALAAVLVPDAVVHMAFPFERRAGPEALFDAGFASLYAAFPDLERRETIRMAGRDGAGQMWVGVCGAYVGTFAAPFLGIPPTKRAAAMRFHEFFRVEEGRVVEVQALWDIPELMMQAGVWPLVPPLGREWHVPGPMTQDGLTISGDGARALGIVDDMLTALGRNADGEAAMDLPRYWHPRCAWYGPSGIGTARGISGFRRQHQIPFLNAMPDRRGGVEAGHLFGEGNYVGYTSFAGMRATLSGGGWLGLPPTGAELTIRSLDFWRVEGDLIRENWVLVDMLHVYDQLGVDVFARMEERLG
ncbi:ester cyclase [Ovoidimarina sediminis]|uniref:ester cyclase n=1 Tax=Ovoidimarina sediminis TaxID=3079856 RepID=UPI00290FB646|nr:ester cyclase [Rhodophyticola sp. MJ-SS7]MDU8943424.1 ester cyclase [Rhodophyticola sp. MJ-SS7]